MKPDYTHSQTWVDPATYLGKKESVFWWRYVLHWNAVVVSMGLCCSICFAGSVLIPIWLPIGLVAIGIVFVSLGSYVVQDRVILFENGLVYRSLFSSRQCLWTDIWQIYDTNDNLDRPFQLSLVLKTGNTIFLSNNLYRFGRLAPIVIQRHTSTFLDEYLTAVQNGIAVYFGNVMVTPTHLEVDTKRLPLARIVNFHFERYGRLQLRIRSQDGEVRWIVLSEYPVPNRYLLQQIVFTLWPENTLNRVIAEESE